MPERYIYLNFIRDGFSPRRFMQGPDDGTRFCYLTEQEALV